MTPPKLNPTKPPRTGPIPAPFAAAPSMHDKVLIVDFGSQVTQLIARRVREEKVYCEIVPYQKAEEAFRTMKPKAVILSGGPASVLDKDAPLAPKAIYEAGVPVLGICYGEQAMAAQLGGKVEGGHHREFGRAEVEVIADQPDLRRRLEQGREISGLDEPRRPRDRAAGRLPRARHLAECADRHHRRRRSANSTPRNSISKSCTRRTARR